MEMVVVLTYVCTYNCPANGDVLCTVTPNLVPPKMGPPGTKTATKLVPPGTNLVAVIGPP